MKKATTSNDPFAPNSDVAEGLAGPIACVTLMTRFPEQTEAFYSKVLELDQLSQVSSPNVQQQQRSLWGLPEDFDWQETVYCRSTLPDVPLLRVIASEQAGSPVRSNMLGNVEGGLSVGFATRDIDALVARGAELGFETTSGIGGLDMKRADGTPYQALECHFKAPDNVYALGVCRPPDLAPVGPIEENKTVGGPSYTGQVMNNREDTLRFYTEVLGYEVRVCVNGMDGEQTEDALYLPKGTTFDFMQMFSPGSATAYFIVLDFGDQGVANKNVSPPNSGVVMWTFPVKSVAEVQTGAQKLGCEIVAGPIKTSTPYFGDHMAITVRTDNGFLVECIEKLS